MNALRNPDFYLKASVFTLLIGRMWQYFFWETPYHQWHPAVAWLFGGWLFAGLLATALNHKAWLVPLLGGASLIFTGHFLWAWALRDFPWVYLVEHGLAMAVPLIWVVWLHQRTTALQVARWATALTFLGHGCYALGWPYPTPAHFIHMTQTLTGLDLVGAENFLLVAGLIDLAIVVVLILNLPIKGLLLYAVFWGTATALARPLTYVMPEAWGADLHRWGMEMIFRLPHGLVPLGLWWASKNAQPETATAAQEVSKA